MNLEHINHSNLTVKFRGGRDYAKIYNNDKRLCVCLRNTRVSRISTNSLYLILPSSSIELIQSLEKYIEDEIVKTGLSSEYTLNSNVFINRHNQLYYKIRYECDDKSFKDSLDEEKSYDIDVKAYYLSIKENKTIEMEVWISNPSDIRENIVSESEGDSDNDSDNEIDGNDEDFFDDIGPSPEEIINIKNEILHKLSVSFMEKDLEIDQLQIQSSDLKSKHEFLKNETDVGKVLRYINETEF